MADCITPGNCTCPGMKRCKDCGYTKHDKDFWLDHGLCKPSTKQFEKALAETQKRHGGALKKLADS